MAIPDLSPAYQWAVTHWKLWGVAGLLAGGAKAAKTWFELQKTRLEVKRFRTDIATLTREQKVQEMTRKMQTEIETTKAKYPGKSIVGELSLATTTTRKSSERTNA